MRQRTISILWLLGLAVAGESALSALDFQFRHRFISRELPITDNRVGDYGLTALVDVDRDGDLDFVLGARPPSPAIFTGLNSNHRIGGHSISLEQIICPTVGLASLDADRDGWIDLVSSGVWYRNTGKPREQTFERIVFDENAAGAHDIVSV
jgi:hypothetical protein